MNLHVHTVVMFLYLVLLTVGVTGLRNKTFLECVDNWPETFNDTGDCSFSVSPESASFFSSQVRHNSYNFVHLNLHFRNTSIYWTRCVVEADKWVWTFDGVDGAMVYLTWPVEYNLLSLGLLDSHTLRDQRIIIDSHGKCDIIIGKPLMTFHVMKALANMTEKLIQDSNDNVKYDSSVWCYKERIIVAREKWLMCRYILCPFEALAYRCCGWDKNKPGNEHSIKCKTTKQQLKWFFPFILGSLAFVYSPIFVFGIVGFLHRKCSSNERKLLKVGRDVSVEYGTFPNLAYPCINEEETLTGDFHIEEDVIFYNPMKLGSIFECFKSNTCRLPKTLFRCLFLLACLSVLVIKLLIYNYMVKDFVVESVRQTVPMGFLSILTETKVQRYNYLPCFYGPIPALVLFVLSSLLFIWLPNDLAKFLSKGLLEENKGISISPLTSDININTRYGSLPSVYHVNGYKKMKLIMTSQILMLLNMKFWKYCLLIDRARWNSFLKRNSGICFALSLLIFPIYCILCLLEMLLCVLYFGSPVLFLFVTCIRTYCGSVLAICSKRSPVLKIFKFVLTVIVFVFLLVLLYLFSIIFVDSFIFISQVLTYTYTGLFANPDFSYGYIILAITVAMYIFESINTIHSVYDDLFVDVRNVCVKLEEEKKYPEMQLTYSFDEFNGISRKLFSYVIQTTRPFRKEIFVSILKIGLIGSILYVSVVLLSDFQDFRRMSDLMQTAVTIFVCLLPKIIKSVCRVNETKWMMHRSLELKNAVHYYCRREIKRKQESKL